MIGSVYFIRCNEYVKIGFAVDVNHRLCVLQVGCPHDLALVAVLADVAPSMERIVHETFAENHARGEWFKADDRLETLIAAINLGMQPKNADALDRLMNPRRWTRKQRQKVRAEYFERLAEKRKAAL
ncbi:MAG TPA: GIY-YIG nuclease family protein [Gammaproteobacteria bacterium]|nr:GIY-YIG nuclease family protein [Gammaproteobacteria bacterium]